VNKTKHKGRPFAINEGILNGLLAFVEQVRDAGNAVITTLVTVELLRQVNHSSSMSERRAMHGWWHISKGINQCKWMLQHGFNMPGTEYQMLLSSTLGSPLEFIP